MKKTLISLVTIVCLGCTMFATVKGPVKSSPTNPNSKKSIRQYSEGAPMPLCQPSRCPQGHPCD